MKRITKGKLLRKVLILTFLIVGLVIVASDNSRSVEADTCENAANDFTNKNLAYSDAFQSYYIGNPTTCADDCGQLTGAQYLQCVDNCQMTRGTNLAAAGNALFSAAWATCTPATLEQCDLARAAAFNCDLDNPYGSYSDPDESQAIYEQYSACILASKIDSCQ